MRRTVRSSIAGQVAVVALGLGSLGLLAGPAFADDGSLLVDVPGDGLGFRHDAGGPFLDVQRLYPGSSGSGELDVRNTSAYDATLDLRALNVVSKENGCLRPETRVPTERCDADGGELQNWLEVTISREGSETTLLWQGSIGELTGGVDLGTTLPAGATWRLRMTVALPQAATNDTMTDSLTFDTRLTATSAAGESAVSGPQVGVSGPSQHHATTAVGGPQIALPATGGSVSLWMLVLDGVVLAVGAALVVAARRGARVARVS